jgi:RNA polymerase sigma-70 factor (family 1)
MNQVDMQKLSDDDLVEGLHAGNVIFFEAIYSRYASKLYAAAYNILRNKEVCEDLIQELFIDLWTKRNQLLISKLNAYLYTSVRNKSLMVLRSGRIMLVDDYATDDLVIQNEIKESLEREVSALPPKCREIFVLSRKEQLSHKEIGSLLNISVKTVENQINTALKRLKASMVDFLVLMLLLFLLS